MSYKEEVLQQIPPVKTLQHKAGVGILALLFAGKRVFAIPGN